MSSDELFRNDEIEREQYTNAVIKSKSKKKVIVAGPGTGKTFLFGKILDGKPKSVTLTFINALVDDLSLKLFGVSEVKTLHGFARSPLGDHIEIYPKLPMVIKYDGQFLLGEEINFERLLNSREDENDYVKFYSERRKYYRKYFGFTDIIYGLTKCYDEHPDKIPSFQQVVIDEFQDFNKLEVDLVNHLATKSPILIAGDDDQALYNFKDASPDYIREKHGSGNPEYEAFDLPFCSRCPRIIVEAAADIIDRATKKGLLKRRVNKKFQYFNSEKKNSISEKYPTIDFAVKHDKQIPWYIENEIVKIAKDLREEFSVLIISPLKSQSIRIGKCFQVKGLENVEYPRENIDDVCIMDGMNILTDDIHCNLGWRIISQFSLSEENFTALLKKSYSDPSVQFENIIDKNFLKSVKKLVKIMKKIKSGKDVDDERLMKLLEFLKFDFTGLIKDTLRRKLLLLSDKDTKKCYPNIRKIPIRTATVQGSKGLAADYVFITHLDDKYFLDDKTTIGDRDIYKLLVALTRAKSKAYLISTNKELPTLLSLVSSDKIKGL